MLLKKNLIFCGLSIMYFLHILDTFAFRQFDLWQFLGRIVEQLPTEPEFHPML